MHKAWCHCRHCEEGRVKAKELRGNRRLPKAVMAEFMEKLAKKEQEMLERGYILMICPSCEHEAYTKVGPIMTCECCKQAIQ